MLTHAGVFSVDFSSNLLWQNCFAPKKGASCAEPRRVAAGILDVCQGGATMGLRQTRLLRRMFSYARWPKRPAFVCGEGCRSREGQKPLPHGKKRIPAPVTRGGQGRPPLQRDIGDGVPGISRPRNCFLRRNKFARFGQKTPPECVEKAHSWGSLFPGAMVQ